MKRKSMLVLVILLVMSASIALYAIPSTFGIGSVNYYKYNDLEAGNNDALNTGLRGEFFFSDILGASFDAIVLNSDTVNEDYEMVYMIDVVLRLPLGMVEPYIAVGPAYFGIISGDSSSTSEEPFAYNVRGGVDVNILEWLSIGIESNFLPQDVEDFVNSLANSSFDEFVTKVKDESLIGITAKVKF